METGVIGMNMRNTNDFRIRKSPRRSHGNQDISVWAKMINPQGSSKILGKKMSSQVEGISINTEQQRLSQT